MTPQLPFIQRKDGLLTARVDFSLQAQGEEIREICIELISATDMQKQEELWSLWIEHFFSFGKITWKAFASVPVLLMILQLPRSFDRRAVLEYLAFLAEKVDAIYFYYERLGPMTFASERERWEEVYEREACRPWVSLALHSFRTNLEFLEEAQKGSSPNEYTLYMRILWHCLKFGGAYLEPETRLKVQSWKDGQDQATANLNQMGLFDNHNENEPPSDQDDSFHQ